MGKLGVECGKDMYYDRGTDTCAYCSQLCHLVDIQGTRKDCEDKCPGYLISTTASSIPRDTTTDSTVDSDPSLSVTENPLFIVFLTLLGISLVLTVCLILYKKRNYLIKKVKRQDCCGDGTSNQPHAQEIGTAPVQPEADGLLAN